MTTVATIHIPPAALEAGARALWKGGHVMWRDSKDAARAAFVAIVTAWPGMLTAPHKGEPRTVWEPYLILPLTEKQDDKA